MITGNLTIEIQNEDDIIIVARLIDEKRHAPKGQSEKINLEKPISHLNEKKPRPSNAEVLYQLRSHFQAREFSRAEAITEIKRIAGYSPAKAGRILRNGVEKNKLNRVREGWYAFTTLQAPQGDNDTGKIRPARRLISERHRSKLRTLQNDMIFLNFKARLERLNPDKDIEQLIDRDLEPQEAITDMKKKYPDLVVYEESERDIEGEFREYLSGIGIENPMIQSLVIAKMESEPFSESELKIFAMAQQSALSHEKPIHTNI